MAPSVSKHCKNLLNIDSDVALHELVQLQHANEQIWRGIRGILSSIDPDQGPIRPPVAKRPRGQPKHDSAKHSDPTAKKRKTTEKRVGENSKKRKSVPTAGKQSTNSNLSGKRATSHVEQQETTKYDCVLCDGSYRTEEDLKTHYRAIHAARERGERAVNKTSTRRINRRMENDSSNVANDVPRRPPPQNPANSNVGTLIEEAEVQRLILYQCEECNVSTTSYDAAVEHAQRHYVGVNPTKTTCNICNLTFEPSCFADHMPHPDQEVPYKCILKYRPSTLMNNNWFHIFQGVPETLREIIMSSSIYKYSRQVKLSSDNVSGSPLYQCYKCKRHVTPRDIKAHCCIDCMKYRPSLIQCTVCEIYFYSFVALDEHKKHHENGCRSFRKVTFNRPEDAAINSALRELQPCLTTSAAPLHRDVHSDKTRRVIGDISDSFAAQGVMCSEELLKVL